LLQQLGISVCSVCGKARRRRQAVGTARSMVRRDVVVRLLALLGAADAVKIFGLLLYFTLHRVSACARGHVCPSACIISRTAKCFVLSPNRKAALCVIKDYVLQGSRG
jgi:hypothetical protein